MSPTQALAEVIPLIPARDRYFRKLQQNQANDLDLFNFLQLEKEYSFEEIQEARKLILDRCSSWFVLRDERYCWELLDVIDALGMVELVPQLVGFLRWERLSAELRDKLGQVIVSLTRKMMGEKMAADGIDYQDPDGVLAAEEEREIRQSEDLERQLDLQPEEWFRAHAGHWAVLIYGEGPRTFPTQEAGEEYILKRLSPAGPANLIVQVPERAPSGG